MKNSMNKIINFLTLTCAMLSVCAMQSMQLEKKGTHARAMTAGETPSGSSIAMDIDSSADAKSVSSHAHASDSDVVLAVEKTQIMPIPPGIFRTDGMDYYPIKIARTHDGKRGVVLGKSTDDLYCFATYKAIDGKWQPDEYLGIKNEDEKTSLGWLDSEPLMTLSRDGRFIAFGFSKNEKIGIFDLEGKCDKVIVLPRAKKDCPWYEHNDPQATFLPKGKKNYSIKALRFNADASKLFIATHIVNEDGSEDDKGLLCVCSYDEVKTKIDAAPYRGNDPMLRAAQRLTDALPIYAFYERVAVKKDYYSFDRKAYKFHRLNDNGRPVLQKNIESQLIASNKITHIAHPSLGIKYDPIKVVVSRDGKSAVALGKIKDNILCLAAYRVVDGKLCQQKFLKIEEDGEACQGLAGSECLVSLSPDGKFVAYGFFRNEKITIVDLEESGEKYILVRNEEMNVYVGALKGNEFSIQALSFSKDGSRLFVASDRIFPDLSPYENADIVLSVYCYDYLVNESDKTYDGIPYMGTKKDYPFDKQNYKFHGLDENGFPLHTMQSIQLETKADHARVMTAGSMPTGSAVAMDVGSSATSSSSADVKAASNAINVNPVVNGMSASFKSQLLLVNKINKMTDPMSRLSYDPISTAASRDGRRIVVLGKIHNYDPTKQSFCLFSYDVVGEEFRPHKCISIEQDALMNMFNTLIDLSADGRYVAYGPPSGNEVKIIDLETLSEKQIVLPGGKRGTYISDLVFNEDGSKLFAATSEVDGPLRVYETDLCAFKNSLKKDTRVIVRDIIDTNTEYPCNHNAWFFKGLDKNGRPCVFVHEGWIPLGIYGIDYMKQKLSKKPLDIENLDQLCSFKNMVEDSTVKKNKVFKKNTLLGWTQSQVSRDGSFFILSYEKEGKLVGFDAKSNKKIFECKTTKNSSDNNLFMPRQ